jgi:hypothetical protein
MDFLTGMAYWGILLLVVINTIIVLRMKVVFPKEEGEAGEKETGRSG